MKVRSLKFHRIHDDFDDGKQWIAVTGYGRDYLVKERIQPFMNYQFHLTKGINDAVQLCEDHEDFHSAMVAAQQDFEAHIASAFE